MVAQCHNLTAKLRRARSTCNKLQAIILPSACALLPIPPNLLTSSHHLVVSASFRRTAETKAQSPLWEEEEKCERDKIVNKTLHVAKAQV